jgi:hypothetical protein
MKKQKISNYSKWYKKFYGNYDLESYFSGEAGWNACKEKVLKILKKQDGANSIAYVIDDIENL